MAGHKGIHEESKSILLYSIPMPWHRSSSSEFLLRRWIVLHRFTIFEGDSLHHHLGLVGAADAAPGLFRFLDEPEGKAKEGGPCEAVTRAWFVAHSGKGRFDRVGGAQMRPVLGREAFLAAPQRHADDHPRALPLGSLGAQPRMDAIDPPVDIPRGDEVALVPARMLRRTFSWLMTLGDKLTRRSGDIYHRR